MEVTIEELSESLEIELIQKVIEGDREAFRPLVEVNQGKIFSLIMRQVRDEARAYDLTQEVFIRAFTNLSSFRFQARFSTWLTRIALNVTKNYLTSKSYQRRKKMVRFEVRSHQRSNDVESSDRYDEEALMLLKEVVAQLKPKLREVYTLCGFEQYSYKEAAEVLRVPVGTVRSRLHKARQEVKRLYFKRGGE